MPRLTSKQRSEAIGMLRANVTVLQVANHFNMPRICIWKLWISNNGNCERPTAAGDNGRPKAAGPLLVSYKDSSKYFATVIMETVMLLKSKTG